MPKKMPFENYMGDFNRIASYYSRRCFYVDYDDMKQEMLVKCWEAYQRWKPGKDCSVGVFAARRCSQHWKNHIYKVVKGREKNCITVPLDMLKRELKYEESNYDRILWGMLFDRFDEWLRSKVKNNSKLDRRAVAMFRLMRKGWSKVMIRNKWGCDGALVYAVLKNWVRKEFMNFVKVV